MISGIGSSFITDNKGSSADSSAALFKDNSETYLQLFLTQLKNQDPTEPFEVADMTNQLSQLNSSEQLIAVNKNLESLVSANNNSQAAAISNFIDKDITHVSEEFFLTSEHGSAISYKLDKNYESAEVEIRNEAGNLVHRAELGKDTEGEHVYIWDGKKQVEGNEDGEPELLPAGKYSIKIFGINADESFEEATTMVTTKVNGIDFSQSSEPVLISGYGDYKFEIKLSEVAAVNDYSIITGN